MVYYKVGQVVPGKGVAYTYYEVENEVIQRVLTYISETDEATLYAKPKMKTLFQPDRLEKCESIEFLTIWKNHEAK